MKKEYKLLIVDDERVIRAYLSSLNMLNSKVKKGNVTIVTEGEADFAFVNPYHSKEQSLLDRINNVYITSNLNSGDWKRVLYPEAFFDLIRGEYDVKNHLVNNNNLPIIFFTNPTEYLSYFPNQRKEDKLFSVFKKIDSRVHPYHFTDVIGESIDNFIAIIDPRTIDENSRLYNKDIAEEFYRISERALKVAFVNKDYKIKDYQMYDIAIRKLPNREINKYWKIILSFFDNGKEYVLNNLESNRLNGDGLMSPIEVIDKIIEETPIPTYLKI